MIEFLCYLSNPFQFSEPTSDLHLDIYIPKESSPRNSDSVPLQGAVNITVKLNIYCYLYDYNKWVLSEWKIFCWHAFNNFVFFFV